VISVGLELAGKGIGGRTESFEAAKTLVARRARRARVEYLEKPIVLVNWFVERWC
jgi:hypothetical protein